MNIIFNGQLLDSHDPQIRISPLGAEVQFGQSVFETFRTVQGRPPGTIKQHWERLFASAEILGLTLPANLNQSVLDQALDQLLSSLDLSQDYRCKLLANADFWWLKAEPLVLPSLAEYQQGVVVDEAIEMRLFPRAKWASPLYPYYQAAQAEKQVFETLFFSRQGALLEGNSSNVIAVINGQLVSPSEDVLPGITVRMVFGQAEHLGLKTEFRAVHRDELATATEIFLTSAVKGLVPVKRWSNWQCSSRVVYDQLKTAIIHQN